MTKVAETEFNKFDRAMGAVEAAKERWDGIAKAEQENPKLQVPF